MKTKNSLDKITHVIFEQRGGKEDGGREDKELELAFRRVCDGQNHFKVPMNFEIIIANKQCNSSGLQLADLIARPIGLHILKPEQENRAFTTIKNKLRTDEKGNYDGYGLVVFP